MAQKPKTRVTALQFDQALLEQIQYARSMNVPVNAVSSAATFAVLVGNRLFGTRPADKCAPGFTTAISGLINEAKAERAQQEIRLREEERRSKSPIIQPGGVIIPGKN